MEICWLLGCLAAWLLGLVIIEKVHTKTNLKKIPYVEQVAFYMCKNKFVYARVVIISMPPYRSNLDRQYYRRTWIQVKLRKEINHAKSKGSRYFLFRKVLSTTQVEIAVSKVPRTSLYPLEEGRKYAQDGSPALQSFLRSQEVSFRKKVEEEGEEEDRQRMLLSDFYLEIARKLGLEHANLCAQDKCIQHDQTLSVSFHDFLQNPH